MNILITGGAGFIGSNLYDALKNDHKIKILDNISTGNLNNIPKEADLLIKDIRNTTPEDFLGIDVVFHCAALARVQPSIKNPKEYNDVNINGTLNVLECCRLAKVKRLVFSSSSSIYGDADSLPTKESYPPNPISPYALQKLACEEYCKLYSRIYDLDTVCLRYFSVYGEKMPLEGAYRTVLGIFIQQKSQQKKLTIVNDGNQRRDFTYVKDVVSANLLAMNSKNVGKGEVINIGRGKNYSVNDIAKAFNCPVEYVGSVIEPRETLADIGKAKLMLGWEPKQDVINWIGNNY